MVQKLTQASRSRSVGSAQHGLVTEPTLAQYASTLAPCCFLRMGAAPGLRPFMRAARELRASSSLLFMPLFLFWSCSFFFSRSWTFTSAASNVAGSVAAGVAPAGASRRRAKAIVVGIL